MHTSGLDLEAARMMSISKLAKDLVRLLSDEEVEQVNTVWTADTDEDSVYLALQVAYEIEDRRGANISKCYVVNNVEEADVFYQNVLFCMSTLSASNELAKLRQTVADMGGNSMGIVLCLRNPCCVAITSMLEIRNPPTNI